ncbi:MAG: hypothetical protein J0L93_01025 [Deltaproteobacteria bacterium]|nr:hypothetical protein [Deltaproteobacteria bacterium]
MIIAISTLSLLLTLDCADDVRKVSGTTEARIVKNESAGVPLAELKEVFNMPASYDGEIAVLMQAEGLRVYGITNQERTGFEFIQIWGFERYPMLLSTIFVETKPTTLISPIVITQGAAMLYANIYRQPKLLKFFADRGLVDVDSAQHLKQLAQADTFVNFEMGKAAENETEIKPWDQIQATLHKAELDRKSHWRELSEVADGTLPKNLSAKARQATIPTPPFREDISAKFAGWLSLRDGAAVAMLQYVLRGKVQGLEVYLNPLTKKTYHSSFPTIARRIGLEKSFSLKWLKLETPVVVELDWLDDFKNIYLVFESKADVPRGIPFYYIDLKTGQRQSDTPIILAKSVRLAE